jgi:hypothetical protein
VGRLYLTLSARNNHAVQEGGDLPPLILRRVALEYCAEGSEYSG